MPSFSSLLSTLNRFLRERTLGRTIVLLLAGAVALLLIVNATTFVMIRRTADFNAEVDSTWQTRRSGRLLLLNLKDAEAAQRGYLITGRSSMLLDYRSAVERNAGYVADLTDRLEQDPVGIASAEAITRLSRDKIGEMDRVIALYRAGRSGDATERVLAGDGLILMRQLDGELGDLDQRMGRVLAERRADSEGSAWVTVVVNAVAGMLIIVLAGFVFLLIRRYFAELKEAQASVDRVNAGLEETVRSRTAALTRANEEVQRFAYIVSHDLRSPLVNVMGYTAELEQAGKTIDRAIAEAEKTREVAPDIVMAVREDMPEAIGFIRASTEKMDRLINAILKLSRDGRRNLIPETLDVGDIAEQAASAVRHQIDEAETQFIVGEMVTFESDRLSIEQIIGNLIDNAIKYLDSGRPGRIEVSGRDLPGGWVEFDISDNGRGIAAKDHERIFELFRRSGRQDRQGEGLGLAFVRNSVRRLGGSIDVESSLGEGSTFRLKFPKRLILDDAGDTF
ncbi:MAG: ATP-binding protein [Pseudomonadota bacterium]